MSSLAENPAAQSEPAELTVVSRVPVLGVALSACARACGSGSSCRALHWAGCRLLAALAAVAGGIVWWYLPAAGYWILLVDGIVTTVAVGSRALDGAPCRGISSRSGEVARFCSPRSCTSRRAPAVRARSRSSPSSRCWCSRRSGSASTCARPGRPSEQAMLQRLPQMIVPATAAPVWTAPVAPAPDGAWSCAWIMPAGRAEAIRAVRAALLRNGWRIESVLGERSVRREARRATSTSRSATRPREARLRPRRGDRGRRSSRSCSRSKRTPPLSYGSGRSATILPGVHARLGGRGYYRAYEEATHGRTQTTPRGCCRHDHGSRADDSGYGVTDAAPTVRDPFGRFRRRPTARSWFRRTLAAGVPAALSARSVCDQLHRGGRRVPAARAAASLSRACSRRDCCRRRRQRSHPRTAVTRVPCAADSALHRRHPVQPPHAPDRRRAHCPAPARRSRYPATRPYRSGPMLFGSPR